MKIGKLLGKFPGRAVCGLIVAAFLLAPPVRAQEGAKVIGTYCLVGVWEMGSCFRLSPGGKFEYFLSYGAYDERSEGTWKLAKGEIIVDSLLTTGVRRSASSAWKRATPSTSLS